MTVCLLVLSAAEIDGFYFWKNGNYTQFSLSEIHFGDDKISIGDVTFSVNDIDSITFVQPKEPIVATDTLFIYYEGQTATVFPQRVGGITTEVNGAAVTLTNANTDREMTFVLNGESDEGNFTYNGEYKACIRLDGLNLKSRTGAALDIKCGKRIALELAEGTNNYLEDAADSLGQKAALYCKGHLEVSKGGTLTVKSNVTHAIKTKEYMLVKSSTGSITVTGAAGDGIHAGQYFKMNGSTVTVSGVKGDGIQAEATQEGDEDDGQVILRGGTLNVSVAERDVSAIKSDSLMSITGGNITITTTGDGDKGIKSKADLNISGGELSFTQSGQYIVEDNDPGYVTSIKSDGNLTVSGGSIVIENTGEAGKGLSADGDITINETDASLTLNINAFGKGGPLDLSRDLESGTDSDGNSGDVSQDETKKTYRIGVALSTVKDEYWKDIVYLYSAEGTRIAWLTNIITLENTEQTTCSFFYYEFDQPQSGQFYFACNNYKVGGIIYTFRSPAVNGPTESTPDVYYFIDTDSYTKSGPIRTFSTTDYTPRFADGIITDKCEINSERSYVAAAGIKGDGNVTICGGTITINTTRAAAKGITCDKTLTTTGGNINITGSGAGLGFYLNATTAKGLTSDECIELQGGTITIQMTGEGAKGIKSDGTIVIGKSNDEGPILNISVTGAKYNGSSSSKAIKAIGAITINGGESVITASNKKAEGLESKLKADASIVINGGKHYFRCYDDCINSAGCIIFDGGTVVCSGRTNDSVDSNYNRYGAIQIGNGVVFAYTANPSNGSFDCDSRNYFRITGNGIAIGFGGNGMGSSSSSGVDNAMQGYYFCTDPITYNKGQYYTLADMDGNNIVTFSFESNIVSKLSIFTATGMTSGAGYSVKCSSTEPTDATTAWYGLYLGSTAQGQTDVTSFTAK